VDPYLGYIVYERYLPPEFIVLDFKSWEEAIKKFQKNKVKFIQININLNKIRNFKKK
jgi:hypothetical protein